MKPTVFLCGPMRGVPRGQSLAWRQTAADLLAARFNVLHAMRQRETTETLPDPRLAVARDKADILRSDIILINDTVADCSMIGTAMEIFFAASLDKILIVFGTAHSQDYWMNAHIHWRCDNLEEACTHINHFYADRTVT